MYAIKINGKNVGLHKCEIPQTTPELNVLVKVYYAGICRTDLSVASGKIPTRDDLTLGHEFCGKIVSFYDRPVDGFHIDDVVSADPMKFGCKDEDCMCGVDCDGAFTEYIAAPSSALVKLPADLLNPVGAYLEPVAAALAPFKFIHDKSLKICIFGDNRIARLASQTAKISGYENLDCVMDKAFLKDNTYDVIIETIPEYINEFVKALKRGGTLILKSRCTSSVSLLPNTVAMKEITICGARYGSFQSAVEILHNNQLQTNELLGDVFALKDFEKAFAEAQKGNSKKIFFEICAE